MQQERNGVDEQRRGDAAREMRVVQYVRGKNGAVGVRSEDDAGEVEGGENGSDGEAGFVAGEGRAGHVHADGEDLDDEDAHVWVLACEVEEEVEVRPEADLGVCVRACRTTYKAGRDVPRYREGKGWAASSWSGGDDTSMRGPGGPTVARRW